MSDEYERNTNGSMSSAAQTDRQHMGVKGSGVAVFLTVAPICFKRGTTVMPIVFDYPILSSYQTKSQPSISLFGMRQALSAEVVTSPSDRAVVAKLLALVAATSPHTGHAVPVWVELLNPLPEVPGAVARPHTVGTTWTNLNGNLSISQVNSVASPPTASITPSAVGIRQAIGGTIVTNPEDRAAIAKLLRLIEQTPVLLNRLPVATAQTLRTAVHLCSAAHVGDQKKRK